ncbi:uncharacterized protein LOC109859873 [Pseudomyrmex gracilis]|uniref:uncharacterized protein LOC109859873 n=1 Tax=Pseudomyrmex gracilis TaxID=219809 RepID=UPI0009949C29|nr:uncharacterized protein LOC109859873 [Pseudomyrmex gracilis]
MNPDEPSTSSKRKPRKRTHSNIELEVESEQTKQQEHDVPIQKKEAKERQATNILDCPDILLLRIFLHVDEEDLRNLRLLRQRCQQILFVPHVQSLLDTNKFEEILMYRNNQFQNYLLSNISRCISRCTNLKILHIRHYSHVTRKDINIQSSTLSNLVELDITGCSVTLEDVKHFKSRRPKYAKEKEATTKDDKS